MRLIAFGTSGNGHGGGIGAGESGCGGGAVETAELTVWTEFSADDEGIVGELACARQALGSLGVLAFGDCRRCRRALGPVGSFTTILKLSDCCVGAGIGVKRFPLAFIAVVVVGEED